MENDPGSAGRRMRRLFRSDFASNVAILASGTIAARVTVLLAAPVLTRLYSPDDFELLAVYMSVLSLLTVLAGLRFYLAVPLPERDDDAANLLAIALASSLGIAALCGLGVVLFPNQVLAMLDQEALRPFLWMVPVALLFAAAYQALQFWSSRQRRFREVSHTRVTRAIGGVGTQLSLGFVGLAPFGLLLGQLIYNSVGVFGLIWTAWRHDRAALRSVTLVGMREGFRRYRRFATHSVPEALFNTAGAHVPVLIIAAATQSAEAGFLALAVQLMSTPLGLLGRSVGQVYHAEAPKRLRDGSLGRFTLKTIRSLLKVSAIPFLLAAVAAPFLFPLVFGAEWARAGVILTWMTPMVLLQFLASPVSTVLHVKDSLGLALAVQAAGFVMRIVPVMVSARVAPGLVTESYLAAGAAFYAFYLWVLVRVSR